MSHHTFQHYIFDTDLPSEPSLNYQGDAESMLRELQTRIESRQPTTLPPLTLITPSHLPTDPWVPSRKFSKLLKKFDSNILNQFMFHFVDV